MRTLVLCLVAVLGFSCQQAADRAGKAGHDVVTSRQEEVSRLLRDHYRDSEMGFEVRGPLTISQVEQESLEELSKSPRKDIPPGPFGFEGHKWLQLKSKYVCGDELYFFTSDERSWSYLSGIKGYVLVRGNTFVDGIITGMN